MYLYAQSYGRPIVTDTWCNDHKLITKMCPNICINMWFYCLCGPGSSAGIATDFGLDGPGIESRGEEIFRPSRPALGPTQPPVQ